MVEFRKFFRMKRKKNCFWVLWKILKRYLSNSSIHGVRYLVEDGRHWTERLFWLLCCSLSWWGCFLMVSGVIEDFLNRQTATTVETNYRNWKRELPSVHVCFFHTLEADAYIKKTWPQVSRSAKLTTSVMFGYDSSLKPPHDSASLEKITDTLDVPCEEIFEYCEWKNQKIDCCKVFHPLWTPIGRCHSLNSIYTRPSKESAMEDDKYFSQFATESGLLIVTFLPNRTLGSRFPSIYILNKLGLPAITTGSEGKVDTGWRFKNTRFDILQQPTYNEDKVRGIAVEKRNCRFDNEVVNFTYYNFYGYDACAAEVLSRRMIETCGCVSHLYPHNAETTVCDQMGLKCLSKSAGIIFSMDNLTCLADCEETAYQMYMTDDGMKKPGHLHLNLLPGPTTRYRRYVVHSQLDLVVAVGSALGLFVGASLLSIVEIPYWLIIRSFDEDDEENDKEEVDPTQLTTR